MAMTMMRARPGPDEMYQALLDRDASYDGVFVVAVKTTGIFCRPTCPARKPKFENVAFHATTAEARRAGFRPCKRCRPEEAADPAWARDLIEAVERAPRSRFTDDDLRGLGIEPARARRYFREHFGMTFHAFHRSRRLGLALADVREGGDLLEVGQASGFESPSGFRDAFARLFGTSPGRARSADCLLAKHVDTPLGAMLAVASAEGVCLLEFVDRRAMEEQVATLRKHFPGQVVPGSNAHLEQLADELARYFAGTLTAFRVPLIYPGSPFQAAVWDALTRIPYGRTTSYGAIAAQVDRPGASQAVGRANGENRLAIVVPCHRVIRSDGHLCGYAGGLRRKQWLLDHEARVAGRSGWLFDAESPMMK
jgi:AraC family transcriptional regulator, regulatory protein of adaptative response / methylated-DNA-[protein]-cysteine methyltransferase